MTLECLGGFFNRVFATVESSRVRVGGSGSIRVSLIVVPQSIRYGPSFFRFPTRDQSIVEYQIVVAHTISRSSAAESRVPSGWGGCFFEVEISRLGAERKSWMYG